jgi:hypothetical protein
MVVSSSNEILVITPEFFELLDRLRTESSPLEDVTHALNDAKKKRDTAEKELRELQRKLHRTKIFCKEQRDRINLCQTHWFFGTNFLQPQLWLRGGCKGKIERASSKLKKSQNEIRVLQSTIEQIETVDLPEIHRQVQSRLEDFEFTATAEVQLHTMEEKAIGQFLTSDLLIFQQQSRILEDEITDNNAAADSLNSTISQLNRARQFYETSLHHLTEAALHNQEYERQKSSPTPVPHPVEIVHLPRAQSLSLRSETRPADQTKTISVQQTKHSNFRASYPGVDVESATDLVVSSTNFYCPSGCGYGVTGHERCCSKNCGPSNRLSHESRCERRPSASHQMTQLKQPNLEAIKQKVMDPISHENDASNFRFSEGRREAKAAERTVRQALAGVSVFIREKHSSIYSSVVNSMNIKLLHAFPHGGCQSSQERGYSIQKQLEVVSQSLAILKEQIATILELQSHCRQSVRNLTNKQDTIKKQIEAEKTKILENLRHRALNESPIESPLLEPIDLLSTQFPPLALVAHQPYEQKHPSLSAPCKEIVLRHDRLE